MNLDLLLNTVLNKVLITEKMASPDSNKIAKFVIKYLEENPVQDKFSKTIESLKELITHSDNMKEYEIYEVNKIIQNLEK